MTAALVAVATVAAVVMTAAAALMLVMARVIRSQQEQISYLEGHWVPGPALVAGLIAGGQVHP